MLVTGGGCERLPIHASAAATSGVGCGHSLQLAACAWPHAGEANLGFDVQGVLGAAVVAVSTGTANTPLGGGCTALMPIPDLPFFRGLAVHAQAAQLDPTSPIGAGTDGDNRLDARPARAPVS